MPELIHNIASKSKVNLNLHIVGYDSKVGNHKLVSLVAFCHDAFDIIITDTKKRTFGRFPDFSLEKALYDTPLHAKNVKYSIIKNIPIHAGFGSVSAIRARLAAHIYDTSTERLRAGSLYSDFGFDAEACMYSQPLVVNGSRGEVSHMVEMPEIYAIVMWPRLPISTADVFKHFKDTKAEFSKGDLTKNITKVSDLNELSKILKESGNQLTKSALALNPKLVHFDDFLHSSLSAEYIGMSGSGAGYFGLYSDYESATIDKHIIDAASVWSLMTRI